uniref:Oleosin-3 n=1 Tax=Spirogyra grevilleana TaxID=3182 RepID=M4N9J0_9VIRI|nr:oleosin-3 [Spirogyra grevilleana]
MPYGDRKWDESVSEVQWRLRDQLVFYPITGILIFGTTVFLSSLAIGGVLLLLLLSPVLIAFSPILVPAGVILSILATAIAGFVLFLIFSVMGFGWFLKFRRGEHPVGSQQLESAAGYAKGIPQSLTHAAQRTFGAM